jgi:hypothetical protein
MVCTPRVYYGSVPAWTFTKFPAVHVIDNVVTDLVPAADVTIIFFARVRNAPAGQRRVLLCGPTDSHYQVCIHPDTQNFAVFNAKSKLYSNMSGAITDVPQFDSTLNMYALRLRPTVPYITLSINTSVVYTLSDENAAYGRDNATFSCIGTDMYDASLSSWGDISVIICFDKLLTDSELDYVHASYRNRWNT